MASITQAENLPNIYCQGFGLDFVDSTHCTISPGQCRSYDNQVDIKTTETITLDITKIGPNGVESLPLTVGRWLAIYAVRDLLNKLPTCFVLSTNYANAPVLPRGYSVSAVRRVGWMPILRATTTLFKFYQTGEGSVRDYQYDELTGLIIFTTANTPTQISMNGLVPPIPAICRFAVRVDNSGWVATDDQNIVSARIINSGANPFPVNFALLTNLPLNQALFQLLTSATTSGVPPGNPLGSMGIEFAMNVPTSGTPVADISLTGFTDYL